MAQVNPKLGFIVLDSQELLLGTLCGHNREVLHVSGAGVPPEMSSGRGTLSRVRYDMHRKECLKLAVEEAATLASKHLDEDASITGLVLAASPEFEKLLNAPHSWLDPKLQAKVIKVVRVSSNGGNQVGFKQAIADTLSFDVKKGEPQHGDFCEGPIIRKS